MKNDFFSGCSNEPLTLKEVVPQAGVFHLEKLSFLHGDMVLQGLEQLELVSGVSSRELAGSAAGNRMSIYLQKQR